MRSLALLPLVLLLAGCTPVLALEPADDATNPTCADVIVRLPDTVAGLPSRETNAQGTGAWGEPAYVILRCGVPTPPPTSKFQCVTVAGIDWLSDGTNDPNYVFTTYGRTPAVEVIVNSDKASGISALGDLADAVAFTPASGKCISPEDSTQ